MFLATCLGGIATRLPSLPPPAPLPSLTTAFSRRAALFGAVVSTGALAGAEAHALGPSDLVPDSMPALYAEARALRAEAERATSDAEVDRLCERLTDLERRAVEARVTTPAGAVAALEWVRADLLREDGTTTDFKFYPGLIGQAIGVLQRLGSVS